ncbi:MAG: mismatch-specific DNA-glycosylase [Candidatus Zixiibacteriota bacterium]
MTVVFCGTAAGTASAQRGHYYAGPGNKFWKTLYTTGLTPRLLQPSEYAELAKFGIGLTDLAKTESGSDAELSRNAFDIAAFEDKIRLYRPQIVCFNGKRAAQEYFRIRNITYGLQKAMIDDTRLFVAPSTSGSASGAWDIEYWRQLAIMIEVFVG